MSPVALAPPASPAPASDSAPSHPAPSHPALCGLSAGWLRASCPCPDCCHPGSGQRLVSITDLPAEPVIDAVTADGDVVTVTFGPDGHRAAFRSSWLAAHAEPADLAGPAPDERTEDAKRLWRAADFPAGPPAWSWPEYQAGGPAREAVLAALLRDGLALLRDVPAEPGTVLTVAAGLGYVRETNYGRLFDVRVEATPSNLAFTGLPIAPHTDNPYRDPVPTLQLLHCLHTAVAGGDSGLVDGFLAAGLLRAADPAAFALLASTPATFAYADATAELRATRPMIGLDPAGRIREIRFNHRSLQPWTARPGPVAAQHDGGAAFYAAYRAFASLLRRPELLLTFRLEPGDCIVFDNTRVLHARTGFAATGRRHLQGCYADLDGVSSALATYRRGSRP
jgi:gamma-butyrobetaine dioxygenase